METERLVIKFGGVSLKNYKRLKNTAEIIKKNNDKELVVVISAIGESTNELIKSANNALNGNIDYKSIKDIHIIICEKLNVDFLKLKILFNELEESLLKIKKSGEIKPKDTDLIMSYGERLSIIVLSEYLNNIGINAKAVNSWELGFITNSNHLNAEILSESSEFIKNNLNELLSKSIVPIVTGFIAKDKLGNITTLGRGGSDLSASYIASSINADKVVLWKDVDGILSSNPKLIDKTVKLDEISFREASEMAFFGAEILHPQSLFPVMGKNISVEIRNFLKHENKGTLIVDKLKENNLNKIKAISYRRDVTMVQIRSNRMLGNFGFLSKVFKVFNDLEISVDMIATSEVSISLTLDERHDIEKLIERLNDFAIIKVSNNNSIVSLIGNTERSTKIFKQAFEILHKSEIDVKMVSYGASNVNICFIVKSFELEKTVNVLHAGLIEREDIIC